MILGIKTLLLGISVTITQTVYPLIPRLYDLFLYTANFNFFDNKFIHRVWNNLYVLVGVVVLFAIAIKLISAMVNPESLTDNKKGAKGAYFRTVIAVILIFVCPIMFDLTYDIQNRLVGQNEDGTTNDNFLMSRIFGYEVKGNGIGQMLAWETFSAFCAPVNQETNSLVVLDISDEFPAYFSDYYSVQEDINKIDDLDFELFYSTAIKDAVTSAVPGSGVATAVADAAVDIGLEYHSILCPLAGLLVVYELILLCMDTIFRAAKIALLELMLPLVLGAFVFNPDILKKWAKEFFSTYISVFLKVLAIGFMILAINALKGVIF